MGWLNFGAALAAFIGSHLVPALPGVKPWLKRRLGPAGYGAFYGTLATVLLIWVIVAAETAPYLPLWYQRPWMRWATNIIMPVAVILGVLALGAPNPLSFGGRRTGFDPARPGLAGFVRHPLLWALFLWAAAHLLVNGDLAHVVLFGGLAVFCIHGMPALDRRRQKTLGMAEWRRLAVNTSNMPRFRHIGGVTLPRLALGVLVWAALLAAHLHVIGVSPLP